ncbi:hypothetical protein [Streptomyces sp. CBMA123]|uniref:hypothetical protein n=1 Tax=Streptomyces sp. CBMA123 TaxID=1896313 RepID=UPI0016620973|nr:hypothetical protein [Streptomyces sp. CBMA123]MBD0694609.1 hypothetical protein [Streptomyces sp. CBMA123]
MLELVVDVLVAVVLTTVEVVALVLAFFAIGITAWADDKSGRGVTPRLKRITRAVAVVSLVLPLACAYGLFLLHLPIAATAQCLLVVAVPFLRPILTAVNRLREGVTRRWGGRRRR